MSHQLKKLFKNLSTASKYQPLVGDVPNPIEDEVRLTGNWVIIYRGESEQIKIAEQNLREFIKVNDDIEFNVADAPYKDFKIILEVDESVFDEPVLEAYQITVKQNRISVKGYDSSGVMLGTFYLIELMQFRGAPILKKGVSNRRPTLRRRIFRSPMAFYYAEELDQIDTAYPDEYLLKMAQHGFNGIWLRGILRDLVKCEAFPEFGKNAKKYLKKINCLIKRCKKYGIKVYFYMTEPLGFDQNDLFWQRNMDVRGTYHEPQKTYALCTSNKKVKSYLRNGAQYLFENAQGLAGLILITASEHHSHCWSHVGKDGFDCPKCGKRSPSEVISEVITLLNSGVKAVDPKADVIAWNWSWAGREDDIERKIIETLPVDIVLMADFERGGKRVTDGIKHMVDEYSLSYIGPSERFMNTAKLANERGMEIFAKNQIGVTHEIATVPYFPVLPKIAEKYKRLNKLGISGVMSCWNFGNILSRNTEIANWFSWEPAPESVEKILHKIAVRDFGKKAANSFVKAWKIFAKATDHYPFDIKFLYKTPINFGATYPLILEKIDKSMPIPWLLPKEMKYNVYIKDMENTEFGDCLENFCQVFGPEQVVSCFKNLLVEWAEGLKLIETVMKKDVPTHLKNNAQKEHAVCSAIYSQFSTLVNFIEFTLNRNCLVQTIVSKDRQKIIAKLEKNAKLELSNSQKLKEYIAIEETLGFHGEAFGFFYSQEKINRKITELKNILNEKLPAMNKEINIKEVNANFKI